VLFLGRMVARGETCIRQLGDGDGSETKRFRRFLANDKVTLQALIDGWPEHTGAAAAGRHVLAIQDTSEIKFRTTPAHRRGLGEVGKGNSHGALLHAMLAVDADSGQCLGLVGGAIWTRPGRVTVPHARRALDDKESRRWLATGERASQVLAPAAMVTVIADRESDIYAEWARLPDRNFHLLTRVMKDRRLATGGMLYDAVAALPAAATTTLALPRRSPDPALQSAVVELRFTRVCLRRPDNPTLNHLPGSVSLTLIEVCEPDPPPGLERIHWRLLTSHDVPDAAAAWRMVGFYQRRWIIEQFFRVLKTQGLRIEDSQLDSAELLLKLIAIAARAAAITIQLMQARDGRFQTPAAGAFNHTQIAALAAVNASYEARTVRQKNPWPPASLAWAAWIIARLGGWDGYKSSRPPGPITLKRGLDQFHAIVIGWSLRDVSTP
jgi:hypothetical protein